MNKLAIVTVLYNSENVLEDFFHSIDIQTFRNFVLYIIDNSPSQNSEKLIQAYSEKYQLTQQLKYLPSAGNIGVAAGNNVGIKAALKDGCDYVLLSNNDILIKDATLFERMIDEAHTRDFKLLVPKIYFYNTNQFWFISGHFTRLWSSAIHDYIGETDNGQHDTIKECDYSPTCFMLIKKEVFDVVGLMNEDYFVYYDDTDFVWRCNENNFKINIFSTGTIEHKEGKSTGGGMSDFSFYYQYRNRMIFNKVINRNNCLVRMISFLLVFMVLVYRSIRYKKINICHKIIRNRLFGELYFR